MENRIAVLRRGRENTQKELAAGPSSPGLGTGTAA